jgi:hypothetical protein
MEKHWDPINSAFYISVQHFKNTVHFSRLSIHLSENPWSWMVKATFEKGDENRPELILNRQEMNTCCMVFTSYPGPSVLYIHQGGTGTKSIVENIK